MQLINCKVELTLKWIKHCVFSTACADNTNANQRHKIICSCDNFISKDNQKLSRLLSKGFERSVYRNE